MFISEAFAQAATGTTDLQSLMQSPIMPLAVMFIFMYMLIIRPQQQKAKALRAMVDNLRRGDVVVTSGGVVAKVVKVEDPELQLEVATGVNMRVMKAAIVEVRTKSEPVANDSKAG